MRTVKDLLEVGSKEEIEKMLEEWQRLFKGGEPDAPKSDVEVIASLQQHSDFRWSGVNLYCSDDLRLIRISRIDLHSGVALEDPGQQSLRPYYIGGPDEGYTVQGDLSYEDR